jgi:murein DD-endopeptidase MepM/ murein hydrolase activator NlpD
VPIADGPQDEITPAERARIWSEISASQAKLALPKAGARPSFQWPLRAARGYSDPGYETIVNYVDQDPAFPNLLKDYNCGTRTYDLASGYNHRGIDISLWPDSWNLMESRQVEIVAAAAGTIVFRSDGNFDRNCKFSDASWNAVYVQHDDGSIAWYGHMKSGTLTPKPIGARVAAGEYLGNVGSSGNSTGPHLHFETYDAAQKLIDPYAGPCNTRNSESWWATQPAYTRTQVNSVLTASAVPILGVCGASGVNESLGNFNATSAFAPGSRVYFVANVRDAPNAEGVHYTIRQPDGTVYAQTTGSTLDKFYVAAYFYVSYTLPATAQQGIWTVEASLAGTQAQHSFAVTASGAPPANYTDLWWNAGESGWGLNLVHQGDVLFATWFTYDADRGGLWLVMSDARRQADGSYSGTIYRTTGTPLAQINGTPATTGAPANVGTGTLRFASPTQGTFSYSVNGVSQQKAITRQAFSTPPTCSFTATPRTHATNYQDLWWNPAESGWGINFAHQGEILFATWFTYGAGGRGQWLVASDLRRQPTGEFRGRLYRTDGTPFDQINGALAVTATDVGEMTVTFSDGEHARMDYTVDGTTQSKAITRQVFGTPTPLCR